MLLLFIPLISFWTKVKGQSQKQPNFVFILTDDHRYDMLGCTGNELIRTPHLDKLADEGDLPASFQGKPLNPIIEGQPQAVRDYLFTENLWSTQFGNPRCESVQDKEWKYIRYYKNENLRASAKIEAANLLDIKQTDMLYAQHDPDIAQYRVFAEAPLKGEQPAYEELYHLKTDPERQGFMDKASAGEKN